MFRFLKSVAPPLSRTCPFSVLLSAIAFLLMLLSVQPGARAAAADALDRAKDMVTEAREDCGTGTDVLARILCDGVLRVGLRSDYHAFSARNEVGTLTGFEVDLAQAIAHFLGVTLVQVPVEPKNRIPILASRAADLVIATMGHTVQREANAAFVRPHYYGSRTVVVGRVGSPVSGWDDLRAGHSVCLPLGASFNILFVQRHIRILTFDNATALLDALNFGQCAFIAHDDTFFTKWLADPAWSARFGIKFGFSPLPWGMAVPPEGGERFRILLSSLSAAWHADGTFLALGRPHRIPNGFLEEQRARFAAPECVTSGGAVVRSCLLPAVDTAASDLPSMLAPFAAGMEAWLSGWFGLHADLAIFKSQASVALLIEGIGYSLAMVIGSMITTVAFAFGFAAMADAGFRPVRWLAALLTEIGQSTPMPLLLFFGYIVAGGLTYYSAVVALFTAMIMLGFYNGSYAGQAIHDARHSLHATRAPGGSGFRATVSVAWTQLVAFLINATKGAPAADMIGVPEFLGVITDLTAHTRDRFVLYVILLIFYTALVLAAIALLMAVETRFIHRVGRRA
jgi:ABC-type amino acid transport substrate-binding protein/ABC-type amino acid transport system permease subunit